MIASEKTLPINFHRIAFERDTNSFIQYLVSKVVQRAEFEEKWNLFEFENQLPSVEFNEKAVFFTGVYETGSCPYKLSSLELSLDYNSITVTLS